MHAVTRTILAPLAVLVFLWSVWWVGAQQVIDRGARAWLAARTAEGWQAEAAAVRTTGYPLRFRTDVTDLALADPATGLAVTLPSLRLEAPAWWPGDVTVTLPPEFTLASPEDRLTLGADLLTARLALAPSRSPAVDRSELRIGGLLMAASRGWAGGLEEGRLTTARRADSPLAHDIALTARGLRPSRAAVDALDPTGRLPREIETVELTATLAFDAPWDRHAIEVRRPQPTAIALDALRARWGGMEIAAAGNLVIDPDGVPEGRLTLRATNWREMLALAAATGALPEGLAATVERALGLLAGLSGTPDTLDAPLTFAAGRVSFGPIPLGRAPLLRLR